MKNPVVFRKFAPLFLLAPAACFSPMMFAQSVVVGYTAVSESNTTQDRSNFGRVQAIKNIDVRSRVSGTIDHWHVNEGELVSEGTLLAEIESGVYQADVKAAMAEVAKAEAALELASLEQQRLAALRKRNAISQSDLDKAIALRKDAEAGLSLAKATLEMKEIDLAYTQVKAPFEGLIGVFDKDEGSYFEANTVLTNLVQIDPVRVVISVSETDFISYRRRMQERGPDQPAPDVTRRLRLADGSEYPHAGEMKFAGNQLNAETATLSLFLEFPNPDALLSPGQFVDVMSSRARSQPLAAVPLASVISDAEGDYVLLVDKNDVVIRRNIFIEDKTATLALVRDGLVVGERVIVQGITKAKIGSRVTAEQILEDNL